MLRDQLGVHFVACERWRSIYVQMACSVVWLIFSLLGGPTLAADSVPAILESARAIRNLTYEQANQKRPVKLRGVVTFNHEYWGFLQDETGGVYFSPHEVTVVSSSGDSSELQPGDLVEMEGFTTPGHYAPCFGSGITAHIVGSSPLPEPMEVPPTHIVRPEFDMQWVEVTATVLDARFQDNFMWLDLVCNGTKFHSHVVADAELDSAIFSRLKGSDIQIRGAYSGLANHRRQLMGLQLFCPSVEHIKVLDEGLQKAFSEPSIGVSDLMNYLPDRHRRVHLRGTVLASLPDDQLFIRGSGGTLQIQSLNVGQLEPGQELSVVGFTMFQNGRVTLRDAMVRTLTKSLPPEPVEFQWDLLGKRSLDGDLIRVEATVLTHFERLLEPTLVLESEGRVFSATIPHVVGLIEPQSRVTVIGICMLTKQVSDAKLQAEDNEFDNSEQATSVVQASLPMDYAFTIRTRGVADLAIIHGPSWWTRERLQAIGAAVALVFLATTAWVVALRRRIREQTRIISEKIEKERVSAERVRIARELHDTLEQELVGIGLQLDNAASRMKGSASSARESIELARAMLRQSQLEARRSIWDLHAESRNPEYLYHALREMANNLRSDDGPEVSISVADDIPILSGQIANHYLRVAQEAITNVIKHAKAKHAEVSLWPDIHGLRLQVKDDGVGFHADSPVGTSEGHFGLSGMRQRAAKLMGSLQIQSQLGEGTTVTLTTKILESQIDSKA